MEKQDNKKYLEHLRHSASHLMAAAVMELYPEAKPTLGPPIEDGFYYDFDFSSVGRPQSKEHKTPVEASDQVIFKLSDSDLPKIEDKMHEIVKKWKSFERHEVTPEEAEKEFKDNKYKKELIEEHSGKDEKISIYQSGEFRDLCRGGHIENPSKELKYFKLLSIAGAYWRGSEKNKMLTRIYGTAFPTQQELDEYLQHIEEAKKRDHRKIGKALGLYTFSDLVGAGFPLYTQKGAFIRLSLTKFVEELQSDLGYQQVWTPQVAKADLFKISGHYEKYKDDMFRVKSNYSEEEFFLKPMNCPQHTQIYASQMRSYKDLPIRMTDFAMLYRDERPGELSGLARVRSFSQDDCHIFCREDQVDFEVDMALNMIKKVMNTFNFKFRYRLSTRDPKHPEKYLGDPKTWDKVEAWAVEIMKRNKIDYFDGPGEAAFYAPKMDLMAMDALGREWQLSTVQIDYVQPARFGLTYNDKDGTQKTPVMLHRAVIGSPERFIMILLEHFAGNLPTWLNPLQVKVLPVSEKHLEYATEVFMKLKKADINAELDSRNETLSAKIRDAQNEKASYMLIVGDKEVGTNTVSERARSGKAYGPFPIETFIGNIRQEIDEKVNT